MITNITFTSASFFILAALTVIFYFVFSKYGWVVLLVASILFYSTWGIEKLVFVAFSALIAFIASNMITDNYDKVEAKIKDLKKAKPEEITKLKVAVKKENKLYLTISLILILLMLVYVKVGKLFLLFFNGNISIVVPLGISYYTFSLISYLADCYWKKDRADKNYFKVLLFAVYFPKIIQGPISRHKFLAPQFFEIHLFDYKNLTYGIQLMLWGYFKKLVIADRLAVFVNNTFEHYESQTGSMLLIATVFGAFQLYCDFSGCMDMACGFSEIIGINLEKNFNHPFFSESAAEFWRRWHITLGLWFKDYVYLPISISPFITKLMLKVKKLFGISVAKNFSTVIGLTVVWLLTGIWHGTGLNYIAWGVYWGLLIVLEVVFEPHCNRLLKKLHINSESKVWHMLMKLRTFILFLISRVLTIPNNLSVSKMIFTKFVVDFGLESLPGALFSQGLKEIDFMIVAVSLMSIYVVSAFEENRGSFRDWLAERQLILRWMILYTMVFVVLILGMYSTGYDASTFLYIKY